MNVDSVNFWANWLLIASLVVGVVSTYLIVSSGNEKEKKLKLELSRANADSEKAKADAAKATEHAAEANLRAAEVEKQNILLRQKFANRRINEKQHEILVSELSKSPGIFNMETMGDSESVLFAADILKTFEHAGWKVENKTFPLGIMWTGLILFQTKDPAALIIADALKKASIPFSIGDQSRDRATIMAGGKPPVF